ncbi:hypothetical protein RhiTH_009345 [Rhizoctonia solani]
MSPVREGSSGSGMGDERPARGFLALITAPADVFEKVSYRIGVRNDSSDGYAAWHFKVCGRTPWKCTQCQAMDVPDTCAKNPGVVNVDQMVVCE